MFSIIVPVLNEAGIIDEMVKQLGKALKDATDDFEVIFVDDGSTDQTLSLLKAANCHDKRFKVLELSRNFGHQQAYTAGLSVAKGDIIGMMDGDLQDPPEVLVKMFNKISHDPEGFDVVYAKRTERKEGFIKQILIRTFHKIFKKVLNIDAADNVGNFAVFKKEVKQTLLSFKEKNRYLPGLRFYVGYKQGFVEYSRDERFSGEAKMNFYSLLNLAIDAIFSFSNLPIRLIMGVGLAGVLLCFVGIIYAIVGKVLGIAPYGWSSTMFSLYLLSSFHFIFLGIIGEYIYRIYKESQNRPLFIIKEYIE